MALLGYNGGLRGKPRTPSTSIASGIWDLDEQKIAASAGIWPSAGGDPYWENVSLLLHMDGSNGSTTFTDSSVQENVITNIGPVVNRITANSVNGTAADFITTGNRLTVTSNPTAFTLGTGDFTIEFAIWRSSVSEARSYFALGDYTLANDGFLLWSPNNLALVFTDSTGNYHTSDTVPDQTLIRLACVRKNGVIYLFKDGELIHQFSNTRSYTPSFANVAGSAYVSIGYMSFQGTINGYMDEVRVTKGVGRYDSSYPVIPGNFPNF